MLQIGATRNRYVRFEVFIAVTMKNVVFWDVALGEPTFRRNVSPPSSR
jgi:hypothetical protein